MNDFENKVYGMGLNRGMLATDKNNNYISPVTRQLLTACHDGKLTALLVNATVQDLK